MAGTRDTQEFREFQEIEIILDDIGGGPPEPPVGGRDGGDDRNKRPQPEPPAAGRRYHTAILLAIISITIFFMALATAFLVRKNGQDWVPAQLPSVIWLNTIILLASSATMEFSRRRLAAGDPHGFRRFWQITTALGVLFLVGQLVAWGQLVARGVFVASNPASSFFYIFTAAHAIHLLGGVCALTYVLLHAFKKTEAPRAMAAEVTSYYWHFMDGLWVFLLALLYLGK
jgi:cytochrome c oxidase subunit III